MAASAENGKPTEQSNIEIAGGGPSTSGEEDELERIATEELLREAKRGAERVREMGIFGWQKSPIAPVNKRFLNNTLSSTLRNPFRKKRPRSRSPRNSSRPKYPDDRDWDHRKRTRRQQNSSHGNLSNHRDPETSHSKDLENIKPEDKNSWESPDLRKQHRARSRSASVNGTIRKKSKSKSDKKRSKSNHSRHGRSDKSRSKKHKSSSRKKDKDKDKEKSKKSKSKHKHESKHEKKKHSHKSKHKKRKK